MFSDRTNWNLAHNRLSGAVERMQAQDSTFLDLTVSTLPSADFDTTPR